MLVRGVCDSYVFQLLDHGTHVLRVRRRCDRFVLYSDLVLWQDSSDAVYEEDGVFFHPEVYVQRVQFVHVLVLVPGIEGREMPVLGVDW